jgi:hypothetical protein
MGRDIFQFWSKIEDDVFLHPDDRDVLERVTSKFEKDCLPIAFFGPLRTAPVILLFLSPGHAESDKDHALSAAGRAYYKSQRDGRGALPSEAEHESAYKWWTRIVRQFGVEPDAVRNKIAILNIGAYHSRYFNDWHMLTALPSSRVSLDWAQSILFPQAERGDRVVVCLRSARLWGLMTGERYGKALFVPPCTPAGIMHHGRLRQAVIEAVRVVLGQSTIHT